MKKESTIIFRLSEDLKIKIKEQSDLKEISMGSFIRLAVLKLLENDK